MHVHASSPLPTAEVEQRFHDINHRRHEPALTYHRDRTPPKLFLERLPGMPAPAAEVALDPADNGTEVVLRLMWGPLPAPFPRVLVALGAVLAVVILLLTDRSTLDVLIATSCFTAPLAILLLQRTGERAIQTRLSALLESSRFTPVPHEGHSGNA